MTNQDYSDLQKRAYEHNLKTAQHIIEIAQLVDKSVPQDNFVTVFNATIQVVFYQHAGAPFAPSSTDESNSSIPNEVIRVVLGE